MRARAKELAGLITLEMGKLIGESLLEVELSAAILEYYVTHAEEFLRIRKVPEGPGSVIVTQPLGVIMAVEPWNFPCYQLARIAGPQIVAGTVLIVKHARNVPQRAIAFQKVIEEAGAPPGVYTNLFYSFTQVNALIDDFRIHGVTLTGSEKAGSAVAERAGRQLKKVVLELGGSDPFVVLEDAELHDAVLQGSESQLQVMGQACASSKRFIVVGKERGSQFLEGLIKSFESLKVGDPSDSSTTLGPLSTEQGLNDLIKEIEIAKSHGAHIVFGGKRIDRPGFYMEPTIITDIAKDNPIFHEEMFGPVASLYIVDNDEEAIQSANATKYGLGACIFGRDTAHAQAIAARIDSGMVGLTHPHISHLNCLLEA
jgi:succinate-semialdehyde dehydrogenase/glutarate-semialdehyde dehydrogenase